MLIYYKIYAYMYEQEMKHHRNDLEFQFVYKVFTIYFGLKSTYIFIFRECINNINSMFETYVK